MRKHRYILTGCLAVVLILLISALPFGICAIMDSTTQNKSHLRDMEPIQLSLDGDMTPFKKLQLVGNGTGNGVSENQAIHTPEQIGQFVTEALQEYADAGLVIGDWDDLSIITCAPEWYYNLSNEQQHNIFWWVEMGDSDIRQSMRLLIDDDTGSIYAIDYSCYDADATKAKAEQLVACFFGPLDIDYAVEDCYQTDGTTWYVSTVCAEGYREVKVEFYYSENGFSCKISLGYAASMQN